MNNLFATLRAHVAAHTLEEERSLVLVAWPLLVANPVVAAPRDSLDGRFSPSRSRTQTAI
jgi:hypothetical protein